MENNRKEIADVYDSAFGWLTVQLFIFQSIHLRGTDFSKSVGIKLFATVSLPLEDKKYNVENNIFCEPC